MSRSVPTLLGIMIILMVVMLVMLIYDYRLTSGLASGATVVGTVGGQLLTGVDQPDEQITASEATGRARVRAKPVNPIEMQREHGRLRETTEAKQRAQERRAGRAGKTPQPRRSGAHDGEARKPADQ